MGRRVRGDQRDWSATRHNPLMNRMDQWALPILVSVGVALPVVIAAASGSLVVPHNDDFNYRRVALDLYHDGKIQLTGWTVMSLIGQLLLIQPFLWLSGGAPWAFGILTSIVAFIGIVASYVLVRSILSARDAFVAVLIVIVFPGFLLNTSNFMTDVPAYAAEMVCIVLGAPALRREEPNRWRWLTASLAVGCFGFSIREFALAAPVAVLVAGFISDHRHWRAYLLAGVGVAIVCGAIYFVTSELPGQGEPVLTPFSPTNVDQVRKAIATLALGVSPLLVVSSAWWLRRAKAIDWVAGAALGAILFSGSLLSLVSGTIPQMLVGNLFVQEGAPGSGAMAGDRPPLFISPVWETVNVVALFGAILMFAVLGAVVGTAVRQGLLRHPLAAFARLDPWTRLLLTFTIIFGTGMTLFGLVASMFDRYLLPLVLPIGVLLALRPQWASRKAIQAAHRRGLSIPAEVGAIVLVGLGASAFALLLNSSAFDAARWRMGEVAVARGFARQTVDAGMEWVGYHATGTANVFAPQTSAGTWYSAWWPSHRTCALVSSSLLNLPGFTLELADTQAYRLLLVGGPETPLYLYRVANPGCG